MFIEWMDTSTERNGHKEPCIEGMLLSGKAADAIPILEERYKGKLSTPGTGTLGQVLSS